MKAAFICLFLFVAYTLLAQGDMVTLTVDFKNKTITPPDQSKLRKAKRVQVLVNDMSTGTYKVSINKTDSVISPGAPPALFGVLSFAGGFNDLLGGLSGYLVHSVNKTASENLNGIELQNELANISKFNDQAKQKAFEQLIMSLNPCSDQKNLLDTQIKPMLNTVFNHHFEFLENVIIRTEELQYDVTTKVLTDANSYSQKARALLSARYAKAKELELKFSNYQSTMLDQYEAFGNCPALRAGDSMLMAYKKAHAKFLDRFDSIYNLAAIAIVHNKLATPPASMQFLSLPYALKGDVTTLNIDIGGIEPTQTPQNYSTTVELHKHPNRLFSFTSGVYVAGLYNREYSLLTNITKDTGAAPKSDTSYRIAGNDPSNKVEAGISALLHYGGYFRDSDIGAFVSFGPGLSFEKNPKPRIMLGAGVMIGRTNRLAISGGIIGGPIKQLSTAFNTETDYQPAPADFVTDKFRTSWFASIGYGIWGK